jgi:5-methylcytosine-specific restriction endonuclease McrA
LDHVQPRTYGGKNITSNLVPACLKCNQDKGSNEWKTWMRNTFGQNQLREGLILSHIS